MCIKVIERYATCRCIFFSHSIDPCPAYGRHEVKIKEVLVGYSCSRHGYIDNTAPDISAPSIFTNKSSLRVQLLSKMVPPDAEPLHQFIPASDVHGILTEGAIKGELEKYGCAEIYYQVYLHARRLFAVLVILDKLRSLHLLVTNSIGDGDLPLTRTQLSNHQQFPIFSEWTSLDQERFCTLQWAVLAPIFSQGEHLQLPDDARLPFILDEDLANGNDSEVRRTVIHRNHFNMNNSNSLDAKASPAPLCS